MQIKFSLSINELEEMSRKAFIDYEMLLDDGSTFGSLTPMKELKLSILNVARSTEGLAGRLKTIKETQTIV